jgi:hypothetical protein
VLLSRLSHPTRCCRVCRLSTFWRQLRGGAREGWWREVPCQAALIGSSFTWCEAAVGTSTCCTARHGAVRSVNVVGSASFFQPLRGVPCKQPVPAALLLKSHRCIDPAVSRCLPRLRAAAAALRAGAAGCCVPTTSHPHQGLHQPLLLLLLLHPRQPLLHRRPQPPSCGLPARSDRPGLLHLIRVAAHSMPLHRKAWFATLTDALPLPAKCREAATHQPAGG